MSKIKRQLAEYIDWLRKVKWCATLVIILLHSGALYGFYLGVVSGMWQTIVFGYVLSVLSAIGTLAGAHRYYSHRSYKAKLPLRIVLIVLQTLTGQKSVIMWAKEHRTHHKYTGTDADCANINRGFFFAHIGWLMMETHPDCQTKQEECDVSDLWSDPLIRFQYNYYAPLFVIINILVPTLLPAYLWSEALANSFFGTFMLRYVYTLHVSFCGNSVAHVWGTKPYDQSITATENDSLIYATMGGAYHNYHHVFPYDYSASELGSSETFNFMTALIEFWSHIGWAYDLKRAPISLIEKRKQRTGDVKGGHKPWIRQKPVLDWILGMSASAALIWLLLGLRLANSYYSSNITSTQ